MKKIKLAVALQVLKLLLQVHMVILIKIFILNHLKFLKKIM